MIRDFREMTEDELKAYLSNILEPDFFFATEVKGKHIVEGARVIADYILRPKPHLVARGFDDNYFAIEVKRPKHPNANGVYRKAVVQAASYVDSLFDNKRPMFTLIFPETEYFYPLNPDDEYHRAEVNAYRTLAHYFNVGEFRVNLRQDRWCIWFGGGRYFCSERGRGPHNLTKRYVGNVS